MTEEISYRLRPGVRVRRESFGLLFYNTRDAKLTFVKSGSLFEISVDPERNFSLTTTREEALKERTRKVITGLTKKGLILET